MSQMVQRVAKMQTHMAEMVGAPPAKK